MLDAHETQSRKNTNDRRKEKGYTYNGFLETFFPNMVAEAIHYDLDRREMKDICESLSLTASVLNQNLLTQIDQPEKVRALINRYLTFLGQDPKDRKPMPKNAREIVELYVWTLSPHT